MTYGGSTLIRDGRFAPDQAFRLLAHVSAHLKLTSNARKCAIRIDQNRCWRIPRKLFDWHVAKLVNRIRAQLVNCRRAQTVHILIQAGDLSITLIGRATDLFAIN